MPAVRGSSTSASRRETALASPATIAHLAQTARWASILAWSRRPSSWRANAPRRSRLHRQSESSATLFRCASIHASRRPSWARVVSCATAAPLMPSRRAISAGGMCSISEYQSTSCHRPGRLLKARWVSVPSRACAADSSLVASPWGAPVPRANVSRLRSGQADAGEEMGAERPGGPSAGDDRPVDARERLFDQSLGILVGRHCGRHDQARTAVPSPQLTEGGSVARPGAQDQIRVAEFGGGDLAGRRTGHVVVRQRVSERWGWMVSRHDAGVVVETRHIVIHYAENAF